MKKIFRFSLLGFFLINIVGIPGFSQDTEKLLDQVINATGGRQAMEAIKDTTFSGTMDLIQMGMSGTFTFYHKEPYMLRQDMELMGAAFTALSFDGETGWTSNPETGAIEDLPETVKEITKNEALGFGNSCLLYPEKYGIIFTEKGKETVKGIEYLLLEMTFKNGDTSLFYIDPETFLPYKTKSMTLNEMGIEVGQEFIVGTYKEVNGINFSHSGTIFLDGVEFASIVVDEVKFNSGLEDSFFKKQ